MEVSVNYLAVLLAGMSSMLVGSVWYAKPVFGDKWAKLVKLDDKKMKAGAARALIVAFIMSLLTAYVIAHVTYLSEAFFNNSHFQSSVSTAFWLWLGISATQILTHDSFEQRPRQLTILTLGNQFVTLMFMGVVIGLLS
ncbi:DUF1761 domain-containing protein [Candidatus Saccharibacteria bacterium]|nr:DUF1761 domain-containing protein [Candidatus Saccharibacteria bacterium]